MPLDAVGAGGLPLRVEAVHIPRPEDRQPHPARVSRDGGKPPYTDALVQRALADWFAIDPTCSRVLVALYRAKGPLDFYTLRARARVIGVKHALYVRLCTLRRAMAPGLIATDPDGYRLTPIGRTDYRTALLALWSAAQADILIS